MTETIPHSSSGAHSGKYLTFFLDNEEYGIEILKVQEIIGQMMITPVPGTPRYIRGVINLRGKIIPVMDLKTKFGMGVTVLTERTCIIVVRTERLMMGILVDRLTEVSDIGAQQIEQTPSFGVGIDTGFLLGMGKAGDAVILLLNIDNVLTSQEIVDIRALQAGAAAELPVGGTSHSKEGGRLS
jgi:purine-binding chemotaxis protein CheW